MSDPILVKMNDFEIKISKEIGFIRNENAKNAPYLNKTTIGEKRPNLFYDEIGAVAELAFSKVMNVRMDFETKFQYQVEDGYTHNGLRYDVKATEWPMGKLVVPHDNPKVHFYALARVTENMKEVRIIGYAWKNEVIKPENWKAFKDLDGYWLDAEKLHEFDLREAGIYGPEDYDENSWTDGEIK